MHLSKLSLLLVSSSMPSILSAQPTGDKLKSNHVAVAARQEIPNLCDGAVNCITMYNNQTQTWAAGFKDGMGPGSSWFADNVAPYDDWSQNHTVESRELLRRTTKVTSNLDRSSHKIRWGNAVPHDALYNGLSDHCFQTSCQAKWSKQVSWSDGSVQADNSPPKGLVQFEVEGTYPGNKDYYAKAIAAIGKRLYFSHIQNYQVCIPNPGAPPTCHTASLQQYNSGRYFSIVRFLTINGSKAINGYMHVTVSFKQLSDTAVCSDITAGLSSIMAAGGTVAGIGSGFFGILGQALCQG